MQKTLSYLPGTYGTSLIKNHMLRGSFEEMKVQGFLDEVVKGIADSLDCNPVFRGNVVEPNTMILILLGSIVILGIIYLVITAMPEKK